MTTEQHDQPEPRKGRKARQRRSRPLTAHRLFAPMLGIWGAALAGLSVIVLPAGLFAQASALANDLAGTALPAIAVQGVLAGLAALVLGSLLYRIARRPARAPRDETDEAARIVAKATRRFQPIDPQRELGSESLDSPVTNIPFAAMHDDDRVVPVVDEPVDEPAETVPQELDLAEFAAMPGRNAVWVEESWPAETAPVAEEPAEMVDEPAPTAPSPLAFAPVSEPRPAARRASHITPPGAAALAQLRAQPPEQLSLIQMVERFAGALYEHRTAPPGKAISAQDIAAREAALTEALKALAALSQSGDTSLPGAAEGSPLRTALDQLEGIDGLRGAA